MFCLWFRRLCRYSLVTASKPRQECIFSCLLPNAEVSDGGGPETAEFSKRSRPPPFAPADPISHLRSLGHKYKHSGRRRNGSWRSPAFSGAKPPPPRQERTLSWWPDRGNLPIKVPGQIPKTLQWHQFSVAVRQTDVNSTGQFVARSQVARCAGRPHSAMPSDSEATHVVVTNHPRGPGVKVPARRVIFQRSTVHPVFISENGRCRWLLDVGLCSEQQAGLSSCMPVAGIQPTIEPIAAEEYCPIVRGPAYPCLVCGALEIACRWDWLTNRSRRA